MRRTDAGIVVVSVCVDMVISDASILGAELAPDLPQRARNAVPNLAQLGVRERTLRIAVGTFLLVVALAYAASQVASLAERRG